MVEDDFNISDLMDKADMVFEADREINTLKTYLEKVTGNDVSLANFTPKQTKALFKVMGIDKLFLEPCDKIDPENNACKQMVIVAVQLSKGKKGFGIESVGNILRAKMGIEDDSDVLKSNSEIDEGEDNES